jgi:hypothetical protein
MDTHVRFPRVVHCASLVSLLMLTLAACAQPVGLLYQQDFEACTPEKLPENWRGWQRGDTTVAFAHADRDAARSGTQSARLSVMTGSRAEYVLELPLPEGVRDVYATVWVRTALPPGTAKAGPLRLELSDPDGNWRVLGASESVGAAADWRLLEVVASVPAGTKRLGVELLCLGDLPGKAWFDDVELRAITELPASFCRTWRPHLAPAAAMEIPPADADLRVSTPFLSPVAGSLTDEARYRCRIQFQDAKGQTVASGEGPVRDGMAEVRFAQLPAGESAAVLQIVAAGSGEVVAQNRQAVRVLTPTAAAQRGRRLNNLVVELVSRHAELQPGAGVEVPFDLPRDGWVYLACKPHAAAAAVQVAVPGFLDGQPVPMLTVGTPPTLETMRWLPQGQHRLVLTAAATTAAEVVVRTVPEILFENFAYPPWIKAYGPFDRAFLDKHMLPHVNTVTIHGVGSYAADLADLRRLGRKWLCHVGVPGLMRMSERSKLKTAEEIEAFEAALKTEDVLKAWSGPGMTHPDFAGDLADEFFEGMGQDYTVYGAAVDRLSAQFPDRQFYAYCALTPQSPGCVRFLEDLRQRHGRFAYECYAYSQPSAESARQHLLDRFVRPAAQWEAGVAGAQRNLVYVISTMNTILALTFQHHPEVDWKVYADMQFALLAGHPEFHDLYGIGNFTSGYMTDEEMRWLGRLYRHYGIEGRREPLSARYGYTYIPGHLRNGDFLNGLDGWTAQPAEPGRIRADRHPGYGLIQGRYTAGPEVGAAVLVLQRSAAKANVVTQKLTGLTPGKPYLLRFVVADFADLKTGKSKGRQGERYALTAVLGDSAVVPEKSFVHVNTASRCPVEPFVGDNPFCANLHQLVFRPSTAAVELRLSDWASATVPGGPVGQELIVNYVQVLPYFEE